MKKYIVPQIEIIKLSEQKIIASSYIPDSYFPVCDDSCKIWHICRDRFEGIRCWDKKEKK